MPIVYFTTRHFGIDCFNFATPEIVNLVRSTKITPSFESRARSAVIRIVDFSTCTFRNFLALPASEAEGS